MLTAISVFASLAGLAFFRSTYWAPIISTVSTGHIEVENIEVENYDDFEENIEVENYNNFEGF
jgi:hypothetical protein